MALTNEGREVLFAIINASATIQRTSFISEKNPVSYGLSMKRGEDAFVYGSFTDEEPVRSVASELRKFLLRTDILQLKNLRTKSESYGFSTAFVHNLARYEQHFEHAMATSSAISANGVRLTRGEIFNLFVHGVYFHSDTEKARQLNEICKSDFLKNVVTAEFALILHDLSEIVRAVAWMSNLELSGQRIPFILPDWTLSDDPPQQSQ